MQRICAAAILEDSAALVECTQEMRKKAVKIASV
jgi:hypothetical protein